MKTFELIRMSINQRVDYFTTILVHKIILTSLAPINLSTKEL